MQDEEGPAFAARASCLVPACDGVVVTDTAEGAIGQILYGSAKTTHAIRAEPQRSRASAAQLAARFGINEKTVLKWRKRRSVEDMPMGPKERRSTVLTPVEEAAIVALQVQARLPLDDVYIAPRWRCDHFTTEDGAIANRAATQRLLSPSRTAATTPS